MLFPVIGNSTVADELREVIPNFVVVANNLRRRILPKSGFLIRSNDVWFDLFRTKSQIRTSTKTLDPTKAFYFLLGVRAEGWMAQRSFAEGY